VPVTIFFCYAREDEELLKKLKAHLRPLQRQGLIDVWYDRDISAGSEWEQEIQQHLNTAQIVLLLISPDFMDSDYCYGIEMQRALERHERGEAVVIPVILRPAYWHGKPLGKLQALPTDSKPVTDPEWHNQDRALYDATGGIYKVVEQLMARQDNASSSVVEEAQSMIVQARISAPTIQQGEKISPSRKSFAVEKMVLLRTLLPGSAVWSVAISADGKRLVSGSEGKTIKVWKLSTGQEIQTLVGYTYRIHNVAISKDERMLTSRSVDERIRRMLVSRSMDVMIRPRRLSTGKEIRPLRGHAYAITSVAFSRDGKLVSGNIDDTIKIWELSTGKEIQTLAGHTKSIRSVTISPDGKMLFSGSNDKTIRVWDLSTGKEVTLTGHTDFVNSVAISADGKILVSGSDDKTVKVWNLLTGEIQTLTDHTDGVMSVAISPNGKTLVSGSDDKTIKVWDLSTGKALRSLTGHVDSIMSVALSADAKTLVSGSADETIKVWDLSTGKELRTLTGHTNIVTSVAISPDGKTLVSGSVNGTIRVWGVEGAD
jgi:WD40 repeat protein